MRFSFYSSNKLSISPRKQNFTGNDHNIYSVAFSSSLSFPTRLKYSIFFRFFFLLNFPSLDSVWNLITWTKRKMKCDCADRIGSLFIFIVQTALKEETTKADSNCFSCITPITKLPINCSGNPAWYETLRLFWYR